jgi:hypothetical protein
MSNFDLKKYLVENKLLNEVNILSDELFIHFSKSRENYTIFAGEEGEVTIPFSELAQLARKITSFLNQVPDVKKVTDLEVRSSMEGLEIQCVFTTSASKEELENMLGKKIAEFR